MATGLLVLADAMVPRAAAVFIGTGVAVTSGPSGLALSNHGQIRPPYAVVSLVAVVAGLVIAVAATRPWPVRSRRPDRPTDRQSY